MEDVPDHFKTQEMCKKVVEENPWWVKEVLDHFKTQAMCERAVEEKPYTLEFVPDHLKTNEMCEKAVRRRPCLLEYVPNWFVTQEQLKSCCDDGVIIKWYDGHQKPKAQKAQIKKELMRIAWHPSRW